MRRRFGILGLWKRTAFALFSVLAFSCTGNRWDASHPSYRESPSSEEKIVLLGLHDAVVVTRDKWFSKRLEIPRDSVYFILGNEIERAFERELRENRYPHLQIWPDSLYASLPEESQKIDERIYIRGRFPVQGKPLRGPDGKAPEHLILIHEFTFGLDLSKDDFFDYALVNNEAAGKKTSNALTVILSYTLWDNLKQRALYSAIAEVPFDISKGIRPEDISKVTNAAADSVVRGIDRGIR